MSNNAISRRKFLALTGLTGIGSLPAIKALASVTGVAEIGKFICAAYRLTDYERLLNAEFYFIGAVLRNGLIYDCPGRESFMIVRIPQQHIAEENFTLDVDNNDDCDHVNWHAQTRISGFSYLVFQLFFHGNNGHIIENGFAITPDNFLDWNAPWVRLVVREDQAMAIPFFRADAVNHKPQHNDYPLGYKKDNACVLSFSPEFYPRVADTDVIISINNPAPITAIEAPYRLILSPELPDHDYLFKWTYSRKPDYQLRDEWGHELWMATLQVVLDPHRPLQKKKSADKKHRGKPNNDKPAPAPSETDQPIEEQRMALAIVGSPDASDTQCSPGTLIQHTLPAGPDRIQLVELYFLAQTILRARSRKMAFTPLGICTTIDFQNTLYKQILQRRPDLDLYQWKETISFGRDQEVQVVNLVKEMCFSFMMLHVRTTQRRTKCGISVLDYREYLIPLEHEKNYLLYKPDDDGKYVKQNYKFNTPFKTIRFSTLKPKQIHAVDDMPPVDAVTTAANNPLLVNSTNPGAINTRVIAFWAKQPGQTPAPDDPTHPHHDYLEWEFTATDWQDKDTVITKKLYLVSSSFNASTQTDLNFQLPDLQRMADLSANLANPGIAAIPLTVTTAPASIATDPTKIPLVLRSVEENFAAATKSLQKAGKDISTEWTQVYHQAEQYLLEKADLFRQHLQNIFDRIDSTVQGIYKAHPEWVDAQGEVEEAIAKFKADYYKKIQDISADINGRINLLKAWAQRILNNPNVANQKLKDAATMIYHYSSLPGEYMDQLFKDLAAGAADPDKPELIIRYNQLSAAMSALDTDIDIFIHSLPSRLGLSILKQPFQEARHVYCFLEHVESSCKSRVNAYKSVIGITLYKVEQGIDDMKQKLQASLGKDWQTVYKTYEDYYHKANKEISNITTEAMIFKNNVRAAVDNVGRKAMDFFDVDATRMQLHSLQGYIGKVNDTVHKEVLLRLTMAMDYLKSQVDNEIFDIKSNAQKTFAKIQTESKEYIKGAMREIGQDLGGIVNPQMAADLVSFYHDAKSLATDAANAVTDELTEIKDREQQLAGEFKTELDNLKTELNTQLNNIKDLADAKKKEALDFLNSKQKEFQDQFNTQKAKLVLIGNQVQSAIKDAENQAKDLGNQAVNFFKGLEAKVLGSIKLKDILDLDKTVLPKLNKTSKSLYYNFITKNFKTIDIGTITFTATDATRLVCYFEKPITQPKNYLSQTRLENFSLGIFGGRIVVEFKKLEIISTQDVKSKTNVEIGKVSFQKELAFLDALSKNIKIPGTGILLSILPQAIIASYTYSFPSISGGAFTMANLKFNVGVTVPFPTGGGKLKPVSAKFGINSQDDPFVIAVSIFGGRGHFVIETTPRYISSIDFGFEFGGYLGLSLGIAQGEAHLMAGFRYVFTRDSEGQSTMSFFGYLTCGGSLTVFGFISISVTFLLCLAYQQSPAGSSLTGTCSLTLSVKIGFFEKSFSLTFTKTIAGTDNSGGGSSIAWQRGRGNDGLVTYADYEEVPEDDDSPFNKKSRRVFTDEGWAQYCKSFSY